MRNRITFSDLFVGALLTVMIATMAVLQIHAARETANRDQCASNLHQIGLAILLYQNENSQLSPRTVMDATDDPKPVWGTPYDENKDLGAQEPAQLAGGEADPFRGGKAAPKANDVTASLFLLLRIEGLTPGVFVCPSTRQSGWDFGGGRNTAEYWSNWKGVDGIRSHLSYSYQNPFAGKAAIDAGWRQTNPDATMAVASDMNPGGDAVTSVKLDSPDDKKKLANSPNHDQEGQNVLYGDGHVEWQSNPFCGTQHDNIFTAAGPEIEEKGRKDAVVVASPVSNTDSILLPSVADLGGDTLSAADVDKLKTAMKGAFTTSMHGHRAVLTVDDKTIQWITGPLTVKYDYQIAGPSGRGLKLNLTAPDTTSTAVVTLKDDELRFEMDGEFSLDFPWKRMDGKK